MRRPAYDCEHDFTGLKTEARDGRVPKLQTEGTGERAKSVLNRFEVENKGRRRSFQAGSGRRYPAVLLVKLPFQAVADGKWASEAVGANGDFLDAQVPVRLSLVLDFALIVTYVLAAYRAVQLVWARRAPWPFRALVSIGFWSVAVGAAVDIIESLVLWSRSDHDLGATGFDFTVGWGDLGELGLWVSGLSLSQRRGSPATLADGGRSPAMEALSADWVSWRKSVPTRGPTGGSAYKRWREGPPRRRRHGGRKVW